MACTFDDDSDDDAAPAPKVTVADDDSDDDEVDTDDDDAGDDDDSEEGDGDDDSPVSSAAASSSPSSSSSSRPRSRSPRRRLRRNHAGAPPPTERWSAERSDIVLPSRRRAAPDTFTHDATCLSPLQLVRLFLTDALLTTWIGFIVSFSIKYAPAQLSLSINELFAFIACSIYMGIVRLPELEMYWQAEWQQNFITSLFTYTRYSAILRCFCVCEPTVGGAFDDVGGHVSDLFTHLNTTFPRYFTSGRVLVIDEAMVAYTGRSAYKQYMQNKPHPYGFKVYILASDKYIRRIKLHVGRSVPTYVKQSVHDLCVELIQGYENANFVLFCDSWFSSPQLMHTLAQKNIAMVGSVRLNRVGMPPVQQLSAPMLQKLPRGKSLHFQRDDMCICVWKDKKPIMVLYNMLQPSTYEVVLKRHGKLGGHYEVVAPVPINLYFKYMRAVDVVNQLRQSYYVGRRSKREWWRLVWWGIDITFVNAYTMWSLGRPTATQIEFRTLLMHEMAAMWLADKKAATVSAATARGVALATIHFSFPIDASRDCAFCSYRRVERKRTTFICHACKKHLCPGECFRAYHALL